MFSYNEANKYGTNSVLATVDEYIITKSPKPLFFLGVNSLCNGIHFVFVLKVV